MFCSSPTSLAAPDTCSKSWTLRTRRRRCGGLHRSKQFRNQLKKENPPLKKLLSLFTVVLLGLAAVTATAAREATTYAVASVQSGETFTHQDAGVQFKLPAGWKAKPDGEVITVSSADDALQVVFWVPDENTFEAAVKELDKELSKTIKNIKPEGKPSEDVLNGMPHYGQTGSGEVNGATI